MTTISNFNQGIFTVNSGGQVKVDYLYDGGAYQGEVAIFSLQGMENLEVGSAAFITEAANRALSNSSLGHVVIQDSSDRARFSNIEGDISWEGDYNGGLYKNPQVFQMQAGSTFAMMLVANSTVSKVAANTNSAKTLFSFGSLNTTTGVVTPQIADITGQGNTFGWEDVKAGDKDFNDLVLQVQGATASADAIEDVIYANRNWLNTAVGQEIIEYGNRPVFETGTFTVNSTGQVQYDYLYDGGWYQGELAVFSLKGMEAYEYGSLDFIKEATNRALSNSTLGRILSSDSSTGAKFDYTVPWENDFNNGDYQGVKTFQMEAGDEIAFMLVQNTTVEAVYNKPSITSKAGKKVLFSTDAEQLVAINNNGTLGFEDVALSSSDRDYNDFVFQVTGLKGNVVSIDDNINPNRDWRTTTGGQQLLDYTNRDIFNEGVFEVGETGEITFDWLFDGGWFQGELAVFSLEGMGFYEAGSEAFISEAVSRALSDSNLGHILSSDRTSGAKFTEKVAWENNFNAGNYQGIQSFTMNPGDKFAFMLVQNTTVADITNIKKIYQWGKSPIFSIPEANPGGNPQAQMVDVDGNGTYAFEDVRVDIENSDRDYNDFVFQIKGVSGSSSLMDDFYNPQRDWRETQIGQELLEYANRAYFDEGVFQVGDSGEVIIDYLYDGGWYQGEVGIFSLEGMDIYETGSEAFIDEAINRAMSQSPEGYVVIQDKTQGAKHTDDPKWEGNYNEGNYTGKQTFLMNPGDTFGMVMIPGATFNDSLTAPSWANKKQPLFSMSAANTNDFIQFGEVYAGAEGAIVGFEDVRIDLGSNQDYNDAVIAIEGATAIGFTDIADVVDSNRNWVNTVIGQEITNYFI